MGNSDFKIRNTTEEDFNTLKTWWRFWRFPIPPREMLPDNLSDGLMVSYKDELVCSGYIYQTSASKSFMLEFVVSNPDVKDKVVKKLAIELLIKSVIEYVKSMGGVIVYSTLNNQSLIKNYVDCGFIKGSTTYEMIRVIL